MRLSAIALSSALLAPAVLALSGCSVPPLKDYAYPAWNFAVSFRAAPKVTDMPASASGPHARIAESHAGGRDFLVEVVDGSASAKTEDQALEDAPGNLAAATHATLGPLTY